MTKLISQNAVLSICIHWIRIRIRFRIRIRIQGFDDQKLKKKHSCNFLLFLLKIAIYLSVGLHKGHQSFRRSLQLSALKREHPALQKMDFLKLFSIFAFLDPHCESGSGYGSRDPIESGSNLTTLQKWLPHETVTILEAYSITIFFPIICRWLYQTQQQDGALKYSCCECQ